MEGLSSVAQMLQATGPYGLVAVLGWSNSASNRLELFAKRRLYVLTIGTRRSPATRRTR